MSNIEESKDISISEKEDLSEEIVDLATYIFALADYVGIDVIEAMDKNIKKYLIEKAKGNSTKYTKL